MDAKNAWDCHDTRSGNFAETNLFVPVLFSRLAQASSGPQDSMYKGFRILGINKQSWNTFWYLGVRATVLVFSFRLLILSGVISGIGKGVIGIHTTFCNLITWNWLFPSLFHWSTIENCRPQNKSFHCLVSAISNTLGTFLQSRSILTLTSMLELWLRRSKF